MKLSVYTFIKDGIYYDYHIVDMLKHHLPLADEIVVNEGYLRDATYNKIRSLDPRIKVFRNHSDRSDPRTWLMKAKDQARKLCTGDWCLLLDCDEFIPEWEFDRLHAHIESARHLIYPIRFRHFYANYKVYYENDEKPFPPKIMDRLHKNLPEIEVYGDGSAVQSTVQEGACVDETIEFECHHFGEVRRAARLRHKWRKQFHREWKGRWDFVPGFLFDLFPHNWLNDDARPYLKIYDGPLIKAVRDNPDEFVRDRFKVYDYLCACRDAKS